MSSWCLQDLGTKVNRKKIETLVTVHVHQRDVADGALTLVQGEEGAGRERLRLAEAGAVLLAPERLGRRQRRRRHRGLHHGRRLQRTSTSTWARRSASSSRRSRTSATSRSRRRSACTSAARPPGPAGTGKTETVKDLGSTLGIFVVVTNCTRPAEVHGLRQDLQGPLPGRPLGLLRRVQPHHPPGALRRGAAGAGDPERQEAGPRGLPVPRRPPERHPPAGVRLLHHHEPRLRRPAGAAREPQGALPRRRR